MSPFLENYAYSSSFSDCFRRVFVFAAHSLHRNRHPYPILDLDLLCHHRSFFLHLSQPTDIEHMNLNQIHPLDLSSLS